MQFKDIIDSGSQPSRWSMGWRRLRLVQAMAQHRQSRDVSLLNKHYQSYLARMVEVVGAQLTSDSDFLSLDPPTRTLRVSRLVQRSLDAENSLRKEVVDIFQRLSVTPAWDTKFWSLLAELYTSATKHHLHSGIRLQRYPTINPQLMDEALSTAQRETVLKIVKDSIEPSITRELRLFKKHSAKQLVLKLSYRG